MRLSNGFLHCKTSNIVTCKKTKLFSLVGEDTSAKLHKIKVKKWHNIDLKENPQNVKIIEVGRILNWRFFMSPLYCVTSGAKIQSFTAT